MIYLLKIVIFHSYVSSPEGTHGLSSTSMLVYPFFKEGINMDMMGYEVSYMMINRENGDIMECISLCGLMIVFLKIGSVTACFFLFNWVVVWNITFFPQ